MKKIIYALFSIGLLAGNTAISQNVNRNANEKYEHYKENNFTKTYPAGGNKLKIENSFGHVKFIASDKNEIRINVHIDASSTDKDLAQDMFDAISVTDKQSGNEISFTTSIKSKENKNCKNCKSSMNINYEVYLPASVPLTVSNNFGNTEIPDYTGALDVTSKFGSLTLGAASNLKNIAVEFGKAELKSVSNLDATFKFSQIEINSLAGDNKIDLQFCSDTKINLDGKLNKLKLSESYSHINLRPAASFGADYNITTSFGSFRDRTNSTIKRVDKPDEYGPDSEKTYRGQAGNGGAKIDITSSFGNIILGEPTSDDMKKNTRSKTRERSRKRQVI